MTVPRENLALVRAHMSAALLVLLQDLDLAMRAYVLRDLSLSESCARNALLFSCGEQQYLLRSSELSYRRQMNFVATKLQKLVSMSGKGECFAAALLEAAIAVVDAESVISDAPASTKMLGLRTKISEAFLALPEEGLV
jgi:hypothetical protein